MFRAACTRGRGAKVTDSVCGGKGDDARRPARGRMVARNAQRPARRWLSTLSWLRAAMSAPVSALHGGVDVRETEIHPKTEASAVGWPREERHSRGNSGDPLLPVPTACFKVAGPVRGQPDRLRAGPCRGPHPGQATGGHHTEGGRQRTHALHSPSTVIRGGVLHRWRRGAARYRSCRTRNF